MRRNPIYYIRKKILNETFCLLIKGKIDFEEKLFDYLKALGVQFYFLGKKKSKIENLFLKKAYKTNLYKNMIYLSFKESLIKHLENNNVKYFFYKGIHTLENYYPSISDRFISDIDLLIDEKDVNTVHEILKTQFKITKYKKNPNFYTNEYRFYENEMLIDYNGSEISLDLHISFIQKEKFNINYDVIFEKNIPEHHFISIIIQVSNDYFIKVEQKFLDLYLIATKENLNWDYIIDLASKFHIKKITYLCFYILKYELGLENIPLEKIPLKMTQKLLLNNMFMTNYFRVNQIVLFFFTFDNINDYKKFLRDKYIKIKHNGIEEVLKSFKKIK